MQCSELVRKKKKKTTEVGVMLVFVFSGGQWIIVVLYSREVCLSNAPLKAYRQRLQFLAA